jgi:3-polyprenyl-4-hydroxybenzoate decarboxylase
MGLGSNGKKVLFRLERLTPQSRHLLHICQIIQMIIILMSAVPLFYVDANNVINKVGSLVDPVVMKQSP